MAVEIPKDIFDYSIRAQISTGRFASQQVADIMMLLNRADKELLQKLEKWGDSGRFTPARLRALLAELRKTHSEVYGQAHDELKTAMLDFGAVAAESTAGMIATQLPIDFSMVSMSKEQLQAIVSDVPIRVGKDSAMLLEDTFKTLVAGKEKAVMGTIRLGMVGGEGMAEITRRLKGSAATKYKDGILEGSRRSMADLVRSVVQHTNNQAALATYRNNAEVLNGFVDVATFDSRTCMYCQSRSGQVFPLEGQGPIWHIGCRCFTVPRIKTWKELGIDLPEFTGGQRASKNGPIDVNISFNDWMKGAGAKTQNDLLGPNRAELFRKGGLTLDKFTDASGKTYTLDVLKEKHAGAFKKAFGSAGR